MGILSSIFGSSKKTSIGDIYTDYSCEILDAAKITINDANRLKTTVYLLFTQLAAIHVVTKGSYQRYMDGMVEEVKNSVKPLTMYVGELAINDEELKKILSEFPAQANVEKDTKINGLAGFTGLYFPYVSDVVTDIGKHTGGPMGVHGYAAIRVLEGLRGKGNGKDGMIEVALKLTEMTNELLKSMK